MSSKLFKASLILIVVGVAILAIIQVVYVPRVVAFWGDALNYTRNWANNTHTVPLPTLEEYGLDNNTMLLVTILGNVASLLVFIGAAYLVILLVARLVKRVRGYDVEKTVPQESNTTH